MFSDFETQCEYHQTEPTAYMAGNSIAARYLLGGELITMLGSSFCHYRFVYFEKERKERALFVKKKFSRLGESGEQKLVDSKDDLPTNEVID